MSDPTGPGPQDQQMSEEELRAYLAQLRQAPVAEIVAQVLSLLANGAQVKLGRGDARVLIDAIDAVKGATASTLPQEFVTEIDSLLTQLRMAQVEGEKEVERLKAEGGLDESGGQAAAEPQAPPQQPSQPPPQQGSGSASSRLWVPGQ